LKHAKRGKIVSSDKVGMVSTEKKDQPAPGEVRGPGISDKEGQRVRVSVVGKSAGASRRNSNKPRSVNHQKGRKVGVSEGSSRANSGRLGLPFSGGGPVGSRRPGTQKSECPLYPLGVGKIQCVGGKERMASDHRKTIILGHGKHEGPARKMRNRPHWPI